MLKTMKNQMRPERREGCRCKGKTPKTFMYVCMYVCIMHADTFNVQVGMRMLCLCGATQHLLGSGSTVCCIVYV